MSTPINLEIGLSQSTSQAARAGGDFSVTGGGAKQQQTMWIVFGLVAVAVAALILFFKRR